MAVNPNVYAEALSVLSRRRSEAAQRAAALRERMRSLDPRVITIEQKMAASAGQVVQAILSGDGTEAAVARIRDENLALQRQLADILHNAGETADNFEPVYTCPLCRDTGFADGKRCVCLETLIRDGSVRALENSAHTRLPAFNELTAAVYSDKPDAADGSSPRSRMERVLAFCRRYGEEFSARSPSLLLRGPTGTGKTQVSLAIARAAAEKGHFVLYGPTGQLFHRLEQEHFGRAEGSGLEEMIGCDLLVMDDLGTEFSGPFAASCLYELLNTRLLAGLPTLISTNLTADQLSARYGEAITSRIIGVFRPVIFYGSDVRLDQLRRSIR